MELPVDLGGIELPCSLLRISASKASLSVVFGAVSSEPLCAMSRSTRASSEQTRMGSV